MSRIESGKVELECAPSDLCGILDTLYDLFAEQMKQKQLVFSVHTAQVLDRWVWCDRKNLNRVLLNLVSSAYKFTHDGGTISASLYHLGSPSDGYGSYEIRIQDNGIGISKEFVERMWGAFERERSSTDSGVEGTGLGLAITKKEHRRSDGRCHRGAHRPRLRHGDKPIDLSVLTKTLLSILKLQQ